MDNLYALESLVRERLAAARAAAAGRALVPPRRRRPLRVRLGVRLIVLGERLVAPPPVARETRA